MKRHKLAQRAMPTAAATLPGDGRRLLFNQVLAWGLSMVVVGAAVCYVVFGWLVL